MDPPLASPPMPPFLQREPQDPSAAIAAIAACWIGEWSNRRQIEANLRRGGPPAPELSREGRWMRVERLEAPQLGPCVIYFEEVRESVPGLAHRQRVMALTAVEGPEEEAAGGVVVARQLFFREGPPYDRPPLPAAAVAALGPEAFRREPGCDLVFRWEAGPQRWRGSMRPCACRYEHPVSGPVYAEFEMLLAPDQLWYRDRSLHWPAHTIRGEVDGFSWLLFDRCGAGAPGGRLAEGEALVAPGVYAGVFRRYDAGGQLLETVSSQVVIRLREENGRLLYHQTNLYTPGEGSSQRIDSHGEIRDGRIWFANERLQGWCQPAAGAGGTPGYLLAMTFTDGSGLQLQEHAVVSADGRRRYRVAQYFRNDHLVRRTLIDEERVSADWAAWDREHPP